MKVNEIIDNSVEAVQDTVIHKHVFDLSEPKTILLMLIIIITIIAVFSIGKVYLGMWADDKKEEREKRKESDYYE